MAVRQRGKGWQVDVTLPSHGRLRPFFNTEEEAKAWEADARHAAKMGRPLPSTETNIIQGGGRADTLETIAKAVGVEWDNAGGPYARQSKRYVEFFIQWFGPNRHPKEVTEQVIDAYINYLRADLGNAGSTVNRKTSALRQVLTKAKRYKLIQALPDIPLFSETKGSLNWLDFGDEGPILVRLKHLGYDDYYDLVCFLLDTGCRIMEALTVDWKTIKKDQVTFENRKNGQFGSVPLTKRAQEALRNRRLHGTNPNRPFGDLEYERARKHLRLIYEHLGGDYAKITQPFHIYRHSCASRLAVRGINAKRIMEWMDHSSLLVTQRYMKLSVTDLDEARNALEPGYQKPGLRVIEGGA